MEVRNIDNTIIFLEPKIIAEQEKIHLDLVNENENNSVWLTVERERDNPPKILFQSPKIADDADTIDSKLEDLFSEIIEKKNSGTDTFNEGKIENFKPYNPEEIKVRTDKIPITLVFQMIKNGDIDLNPDFQRHLVWDQMQKSLLIESILLRIPLPMFYFAEDKEGKLSVVDGLQRISAIKDFMNNEFPLKNLQYLENTCANKFYETNGNKKGIDAKYFRWFNLTTISANIIDPSSPFQVKYDIFRRINTGGKPLKNQEIRNCLTGQGLRETLKEMTEMEEFKTATDNSIKSKRMEDQEVILRFLMFYDKLMEDGNIDSYSGNMEASLDAFTEDSIKKSKADFKEQIKKFSTAMKNAEYLIGRRHAFRKIVPGLIGGYKQLINKALFACTSILLAGYEHEKIVSQNKRDALLNPLANKIKDDKQLLDYLSYGTNGKANLLHIYSALKELFEKEIKYE